MVPRADSLFQLDILRAAIRLLAAGRSRAAALCSIRDVIYLRADIPAVYGRDAVRALFRGSPRALSWEPLGGGVSYDLRFAYTFGVAARLRERDQEVPILFEQYVAVWRRETGRPWRIVAYAEVGAPSEFRDVLDVEADAVTTRDHWPHRRSGGASACR